MVSDYFTFTANFILIMIHVYEANHALHFPNFQAKQLIFIFIANLKGLGNTSKKAAQRRFREFSLITWRLCHDKRLVCIDSQFFLQPLWPSSVSCTLS